jgi:S1-C subfamily serine protease
MRIYFTILLLLMISAVAYTLTKESPLQHVLKQTVMISNESMEGVGRGTGVLLDETHVLTCAHMLHDDNDLFFVYTYPIKHVYTAHWEARVVAQDLMILVLNSSAPVVSKPVFTDKWELGDPIYVIGNTLGGMGWFVSQGVMSGQEHGYLLTDAEIEHGNSGGPWVNEKGEIVALTDWTLDETGVHGGISGVNIKAFLDSYNARNDVNALLKALIGNQ